MKFNVLFMCTVAIMFSMTSCDFDVFKPCLEAKGDKETRVFDVDPFEGFSLQTVADILLIDGDANYLEITAAENILDKIEEGMEINDDILIIDIDGCTNILRHEVSIVMTVPGLKEIGVNGLAEINSDSTLLNTASDIIIDCSGSADVDLDLGALESLDVKVTGSADFDLTGSASVFNIDISGTADIRSFGFESQDCEINISGSGNCEVFVQNTLSVDINGSGDICYKGEPVVDNTISGTGEVSNCN